MAPSRRDYVDAGQTSRRLLDLQPDTPYSISLVARTGAGYGPVFSTEDRTLEMSGNHSFICYWAHSMGP